MSLAAPAPRRPCPPRRFLAVSLTGLGLLAVAGCGRRQTAVERGIRHQVLYIGNGAEPRDLDPQLVVSYNDFNIVLALFEGLTAIDERTSRPVPALAKRWDVSPDGLVWTFHLRHDARWSNGDPLTAADFVFGVRRALSPRLASEYAYALFPIKNAEAFADGRISDFSQVGVRAPDPYTVQYTLARPAPYLAAAAALPVWFPAHRATIGKYGRFDGRDNTWTQPGHMVCDGPFLLKVWKPNDRIVVDRNPDYWDARRVRLTRIVFYPMSDANTQEAAFRTGQLDITSDLPVAKIAVYRRDDPAALRIDPFLDTAFLRFNTTRPPFKDPRVRQALARAIDRTALVRDVLRGGQRPAHCLTPPDTAGYTARAAIPDDFAGARQLLAAAGYPGGRGFRRVQIQFATSDSTQRLLEALQQMWRRELGIVVALVPKEKRVWLNDERQLNYDISFAHWYGDYVDPSTYLELFASDSGNNSTGWANARYDQLVKTAAGEMNTKRRDDLYQQAEALLLHAAPIAPIYFGTHVYLCNPAVKNWYPSLLGVHQYKYVYLEEIKS